MQNIDLSFAQDPNTLSLAILYGMVPAVLWLYYWSRENRERPRHGGILTACFVGGVFMVIAALPVEKWIATLSNDDTVLTILWASAEELLKFAAFAFIVLRSRKAIEEPIDYAIYVMVVAFGFAGFENALYFLQPLQAGDTITIFLSGTMRYMGTTLMHAITASLAGIALGLMYYRPRMHKVIAVCIGLFLACAFHSVFNLMIVQNNGENFFQVFGMIWLATIGILILYERLRAMSTGVYRAKQVDALFANLDAQYSSVLQSAGLQPTDEISIATRLAEKGIATTAPEFVSFQKLLALVRTLYAGYLEGTGTPNAKIEEAAHSIVADAVSPKVLSGIISIIKLSSAERLKANEANAFIKVE